MGLWIMKKLNIIGYEKVREPKIRVSQTGICDFCDEHNKPLFHNEKRNVDICLDCLEQLFEAKEMLKK